MLAEHRSTRELRANVFMLEPSKTREFERAMAELQQGSGSSRARSATSRLSYRWDLLETWLPDKVAEDRRLSRETAVRG
jgi:hypothetical protein